MLYPQFETQPQHSLLMWQIQDDGIASLGAFLKDCHAQAEPACDTVLLSGEDFENALVDVALAADIEKQATSAGFDQIVWVVVTRDKHDYAASIYAEMSKHDVVLRKKIVAEALEKRGCLYVASRTFNFIFALDFNRFKDRFAATISGELWTYSMKEFLSGETGGTLLKRIMGPERYDTFAASADASSEVANRRISKFRVELNYIATAIGLRGLVAKFKGLD